MQSKQMSTYHISSGIKVIIGKFFIYKLFSTIIFSCIFVLAPLSILKMTSNEALAYSFFVIFGIGNLIGVFPAGRLMDKHGRRPVFIAVAGGQLICLLLLGLALLTDMSLVFLGLLLLLGMVFEAGTLIDVVGGDISSPGEQGKVIGMLVLAGSLGMTIGPFIGGGLSDLIGGFRLPPLISTWMIFAVLASVPLVCIISIHTEPKKIAKKLDEYYPQICEDYPSEASEKARLKGKLAQTATTRQVLKRRFLRVLFAVTISITIPRTAVVSLLAIVLTQRGYCNTLIGMAFTVMGIGTLIASYPVGFIADKAGYKPVLILAFLVAIVTAPAIFICSSLWLMYVFLLLFGMSFGGTMCLGPIIITDIAGPAKRMQLMALVRMVARITGIAAALLAIYVNSNFGWQFVGYVVMVAMLVTLPFIFSISGKNMEKIKKRSS